LLRRRSDERMLDERGVALGLGDEGGVRAGDGLRGRFIRFAKKG
jgi:hypothetical protein